MNGFACLSFELKSSIGQSFHQSERRSECDLSNQKHFPVGLVQWLLRQPDMKSVQLVAIARHSAFYTHSTLKTSHC